MLSILFGGNSSEHDISCKSAVNVASNYNGESQLIGIDREGLWHISSIKEGVLKAEGPLCDINVLKGTVVFPMLHGNGGEDGKIQGLLDCFNIPYIGCGVEASVSLYNKHIMKQVTTVPTTDSFMFDIADDIDECWNKVSFWDTMFVKPVAEGSSFGVNRITDYTSFVMFMKEAFGFCSKVLVEKDMSYCRELEVAALQTKQGWIFSHPGEILSPNNFYSYEDKYFNDSTLTVLADDISVELKNQMHAICESVVKDFGIEGLSRIDFFMYENELYVNEVNTMPGFTSKSMYPVLMNNTGFSYNELIDMLIRSVSLKGNYECH